VSYLNSTAACKPLELTIPSTIPWREWWRVQSHIDGTDWHALLSDRERVLRAPLAPPFSTTEGAPHVRSTRQQSPAGNAGT
jgi:hypothetical protein